MQWKWIRLGTMRLPVQSWPCLVGWGSGVAVSCAVGRRCGLDLALLWLWRRPAAIAPTGPLAWESPYAKGVALKRQNTHTQKEEEERCGAISPFQAFCRSLTWNPPYCSPPSLEDSTGQSFLILRYPRSLYCSRVWSGRDSPNFQLIRPEY